jgi:hypothetical protein
VVTTTQFPATGPKLTDGVAIEAAHSLRAASIANALALLLSIDPDRLVEENRRVPSGQVGNAPCRLVVIG